MEKQRIYVCIDLKSFYASVECCERGLDPMRARLVVADPDRTEKTICLAVSPAMKALGVPGRCRVFEIPPDISYIMAPPRMQLYIDYSASIYGIYLKYVSEEDIHVYSIDEVFMDVTDYLSLYRTDARGLSIRIMKDILEHTGIPATAGIGTNLYLAKIALDITAKHVPDRIGELDEETYRETLWEHRPLTDFWRIGRGTARRLSTAGITTMGGIAHADEELLYRMFGVDAELLIDHAWGREPVTIADIKAYRPRENSLFSGQVLARDYSFPEARLVVKEMADALCLEMAARGQAAGSVTLHVGYCRRTEKPPARGTERASAATRSSRELIACTVRLFDRITDRNTPVRRISLSFNRVSDDPFRQLDLFGREEEEERENRMQEAVLGIRERFGKNAVLRGMDLQEGATAAERNRQIGGHRSGV
jgi:nucleotidyltransferase/DNA polymerase involved in DNA repair